MLRRNVLIFHSGALGDFVLTWPLAVALGRLHPQSRIIYIAHASKGELAGKVLRLDWRDAETGWPALYGDPAALPEACRKAVVEAHSIYTFVAAPGDAWLGRVLAISPQAAVVPLRMAPPEGFTRHATDHLLDQLAPIPAIHTAVEQILASTAAKGLGTVRPPKPPEAPAEPVLVHPGSGSRDKCWPVEHFLALLDRLAVAGKKAKVVLGEVELERFSAADLRRLESSAPSLRPKSYSDLLAELVTAGAFVGNDSGPAHLAGIIGVPTLALFGPTDPAVWRPLGPRVRALRGQSLATLSVDDVYDRIGPLGQIE